ncbi:Elongation factor 1-beta [Phlyctochytrium bullatum]|nr:Elongation factor 1-beta [Phlyctochytrium bullatum]
MASMLAATLATLLISPAANALSMRLGQVLSAHMDKFTTCGQACFEPNGLTFKSTFTDAEAMLFCDKWQENAGNAVTDCCFQCSVDGPDFGHSSDVMRTCGMINSGMLPARAIWAPSSDSNYGIAQTAPPPSSGSYFTTTSSPSPRSNFSSSQDTPSPSRATLQNGTSTSPYSSVPTNVKTSGVTVPLYAVIAAGVVACLIVVICVVIAIVYARRRKARKMNGSRRSDPPETNATNMPSVPMAALTVAQIRGRLTTVATLLKTAEEIVQNTQRDLPGVFFFFDSDHITDIWRRFEALAATNNSTQPFLFYVVDLTSSRSAQQIIEQFSIGQLPCTLVFSNGREVERANGSSSREFSQVEDYVRHYVDGTFDRNTPGVVRLFSKPSGNEENDIKVKFRESMAHVYEKHGLTFEIIKIEKVNNSSLEKEFLAKKKELKESGRPHDVRCAFHATPSENVESICQQNLDPRKCGATDSGYFGKGFYFSTHADYCARYINKRGIRALQLGDHGKIIMFEILPGRTFTVGLTTRSFSMKRKEGYDSHISPKKAEWVLFHPSQFVPRAVIEFRMVEAAQNEFPGGYEGYVH